jgi:hypothetical protein
MCRSLSYSRGGGSNISSPGATVPPSIPADFCRDVKSSLSSHSSLGVVTSIHAAVGMPHMGLTVGGDSSRSFCALAVKGSRRAAGG